MSECVSIPNGGRRCRGTEDGPDVLAVVLVRVHRNVTPTLELFGMLIEVGITTVGNIGRRHAAYGIVTGGTMGCVRLVRDVTCPTNRQRTHSS